MSVQWFHRETLMCAAGYRVTETEVVLDIGCGIRPQTLFKPKLHICCEPHDEYVTQLKREYGDTAGIAIIRGTAQDVARMFRDKSVDSVFLLDLIEHLEKDDGKRLLAECERIARKEIVVFAPLGFCPQEYHAGETDAWGLNGGVWQTHRSGWTPDDFDGSWDILASEAFHIVNGKGETLDPPVGALWAFKPLGDSSGNRDAVTALPLVTVITPAYNRASYLNETIQSVLGQGYPRIEHIVLDDGSTDNTREVLEKYNGRIAWETHSNMGESRSVNKGFSMAHGDIVVVVNSDDPLLPGAVSEAVDFMRSRADILVAYPDFNKIGPHSELLYHVRVQDYDYLRFVRRFDSYIGPGAFIRRKCLELTHGRDPRFRFAADWEYWLRLGLYGQFARIPKTLATHREHADSMIVSGRGPMLANEYIALVKEYYSRSDLPPEIRRVRREAFGSAYLRATGVCGRDLPRSIKWWAMAIFYHPPVAAEPAVRALWRVFCLVPAPVRAAVRKCYRQARGLLPAAKAAGA